MNACHHGAIHVPQYRRRRGANPDRSPRAYTVKKNLPVEEADIAPWFDQPGGGKQYWLVDPADVKERYSVQDAIDKSSYD